MYLSRRTAAPMRFLDHVLKHDRVWICRRVDIARDRIATHSFRPVRGVATPDLSAQVRQDALESLSKDVRRG